MPSPKDEAHGVTAQHCVTQLEVKAVVAARYYSSASIRRVVETVCPRAAAREPVASQQGRPLCGGQLMEKTASTLNTLSPPCPSSTERGERRVLHQWQALHRPTEAL